MLNKPLFIATCAPGLEELLLKDLKKIHVARPVAVKGGVEFQGDFKAAYRVNLRSHIAARVLFRLDSFKAYNLEELKKFSEAQKWEDFITPSDLSFVHIQVKCTKSAIYHSGAAAQRIAQALCSKFQSKESPCFGPAAQKDCKLRIQVKINKDLCTISVDTSGEPLYKRGYKIQTTQAPLRENYAAAALEFAGYDFEEPVMDPMCGSATFLIEAALMSTGTAPGAMRAFTMENWPMLKSEELQKERTRVLHHANCNKKIIWGMDISQKAVNCAFYNIKKAGFPWITVSQAELGNTNLIPSKGLIITNPPWGKRLSNNNDIKTIYKKLGTLIKNNPGWRLCLACADSKLAKTTGLNYEKVSPTIPFGGQPLRFYLSKSFN